MVQNYQSSERRFGHPFRRYSLNLSLASNQPKMFDCAGGESLIVSNGIIPLRNPTHLSPRPFIQFDEFGDNVQKFDLLPFSVFKLSFERFYVWNQSIQDDNDGVAVDHDFSQSILFYASSDKNAELQNFRQKEPWRIGKQAVTTVDTVIEREVPVPLGARYCTVMVQNNVTGAVNIIVQGRANITGTLNFGTPLYSITTDDSIAETFDVTGFHYVRLRHEDNGATGNFQWAMEFK